MSNQNDMVHDFDDLHAYTSASNDEGFGGEEFAMPEDQYKRLLQEHWQNKALKPVAQQEKAPRKKRRTVSDATTMTTEKVVKKRGQLSLNSSSTSVTEIEVRVQGTDIKIPIALELDESVGSLKAKLEKWATTLNRPGFSLPILHQVVFAGNSAIGAYSIDGRIRGDDRFAVFSYDSIRPENLRENLSVLVPPQFVGEIRADVAHAPSPSPSPSQTPTSSPTPTPAFPIKALPVAPAAPVFAAPLATPQPTPQPPTPQPQHSATSEQHKERLKFKGLVKSNRPVSPEPSDTLLALLARVAAESHQQRV